MVIPQAPPCLHTVLGGKSFGNIFMFSFLSSPLLFCSPEYVSFKLEPENTTVYQGHTAVLHCQASGDPAPYIQWKKKDARAIRSRSESTGTFRSLYNIIWRRHFSTYLGVFVTFDLFYNRRCYEFPLCWYVKRIGQLNPTK